MASPTQQVQAHVIPVSSCHSSHCFWGRLVNFLLCNALLCLPMLFLKPENNKREAPVCGRARKRGFLSCTCFKFIFTALLKIFHTAESVKTSFQWVCRIAQVSPGLISDHFPPSLWKEALSPPLPTGPQPLLESPLLPTGPSPCSPLLCPWPLTWCFQSRPCWSQVRAFHSCGIFSCAFAVSC